MTARFRLLAIGFLAGALTVFAAHRIPDWRPQAQQPVALELPAALQDYERARKYLEGWRQPQPPLNSERDLLAPMKPCYYGSKLCHLLAELND